MPELAGFAAAIAQDAGRVLLDRFGSVLDIHVKGGNPRDLVTDADLAAERVILDGISRSFPDHALLSEEAGASSLSSEYCWVIDPLDGTTNFTQGIPLFAVSIAVTLHGEAVVGVVYHPVTGELFHARRGEGAFLGEQPLAVSSRTALNQAMVCVEWGKSEASLERGLRRLDVLTRRANKLRALGSAALNLAYVAAGRFDAFVADGLQPWDVAAGALLVQEAGGRVTEAAARAGAGGTKERLHVASNTGLHEEIVGLVGSL